MSTTLRVICAIGLLLACGCGQGDRETASGDAEAARDTATASPSHSAAGALVSSSREEACRTQMISLASAESMHFARFDSYTDAAGLAASDIMPEARSMTCPSSGEAYVYLLSAHDGGMSTYRIECPAGHGAISDGVPSWQ